MGSMPKREKPNLVVFLVPKTSVMLPQAPKPHPTYPCASLPSPFSLEWSLELSLPSMLSLGPRHSNVNSILPEW